MKNTKMDFTLSAFPIPIDSVVILEDGLKKNKGSVSTEMIEINVMI